MCKTVIKLVFLSLALCLFNQTAYSDSYTRDAKNPVHDLQYGQGLYYFYLNEPLNALTQLAIKDKKPYFGDTAKLDKTIDDLLLDTALKLDYQMSLSAKILLDNKAVQAEIENGDRLWLYLAQRFYQKQLFAQALSSLQKIQQPQHLDDDDLWYFLQLQIGIKTRPHNQINLSQWTLLHQAIAPNSIYSSYGANNLAMAHYQQQQYETAYSLIDSAIDQTREALNDEALQLHQHLLISAAFMRFYQNDSDAASSYFKQLSLDSLFIDKALLGFGQLAAAKDNAPLALRLWQKAQAYPIVSKAKIKALNNMALLQEKLADKKAALDNFESVDRLCGAHLQQLQDLKLRNERGELLKPILHFHQTQTLKSAAINSEQEEAAFNEELKNNEFLLQLINNDAYLALLQHHQDLRNIHTLLTQWHDELPLYRQIIQSKRQAFKEKQAWAKTHNIPQRPDPSQSKYTQLAQQLADIEARQDTLALLSEKQLLLQKKIHNSDDLLQKIPNDPFLVEYQQQLRRVNGALIWQASEQYHQNLWHSKQQLKALKQALEEKALREQRFVDSFSKAGRFEKYEQQLTQEQQRLLTLKKQITPLLQQTLDALNTAFTEQWQQERAAILALQKSSRIAIARVSEHFMQVDHE